MPEMQDDQNTKSPQDQPGHFIGFYDRSMVLTYLGLIFAVLGIYMVLRGDMASSVVCLMLAGGCDMFDGTIARTCSWRSEREKKYGIQIDSLSDMTSFVILPGAISIGIVLILLL